MPADLKQLDDIQTGSRAHAKTLNDLAGRHDSKVLPRLRRLVEQLVDETALSESLALLASTALSSHGKAVSTARKAQQLRENAGQSIAEALAKHTRLTNEAAKVRDEVGPATVRRDDASRQVSSLDVDLQVARASLTGAQPERLATQHHLRQLLSLPAVAHALLLETPLQTDDALLEQAEQVLAGRRTFTRLSLSKSYDEARSALATTWTLARDDAGADLPELDLYVLTHAETSYRQSPQSVRPRSPSARTSSSTQLSRPP